MVQMVVKYSAAKLHWRPEVEDLEFKKKFKN